MQRNNRLFAFTLLELLVVLVIMGVVFTFSVLAINRGVNEKAALRAGQEFSAVLKSLSERAIIHSIPLAIKFQENQYSVYHLSESSQGLKWVKNLKMIRRFSEVVQVHLSASLSVPRLNHFSPEIVFFPNGELSPFTIRFQAKDQADYCVTGKLSGDVVQRICHS
jgi:general secretion pathway protein H